MRNSRRIQGYLRSVRSSLRAPKQQRRRVLEEIENHLHDGAAAHMRRGETQEQAIALAIDELGPPDAVAAAFNHEGTTPAESTGVVRWLPMVLPMLLFMLALGSLLWSLTWIPGGLTVGERVVQRTYLVIAVITGILSYATYFSIRRARADQAWRWAAWFCAGLALLTILAPWMW